MRKAASRTDLEEREERELQPYAMRARRSRGRAEPEPEDPRRTAFQRDRDRIVHSRAFRRLQYKTQVFVNLEGGVGGETSLSPPDYGDHYRTRLTHTIEVAQVGRTLARTLGLNEDLVEAVALAHDLGHTPFGHSGGDALDACMAGRGGFEHNRQSLRVVEVLERPSTSLGASGARRRGLNLTREVREALAKHEPPDPALAPLLEAQLVDVCDALAYDAHDVDDGLRSGLIAGGDLEGLALWRRSGTVSRLIDLAVTDLADATAARLEAESIGSVEDARALGRYVVGFSAEVEEGRRRLERFLHERLYRHPRVMQVRERARAMLEDLFRAYERDPALMPGEWRAWAGEVGIPRAVCDYIAGMTDRFARQEWERIGS